jgi:CHAT domain-containing protein
LTSRWELQKQSDSAYGKAAFAVAQCACNKLAYADDTPFSYNQALIVLEKGRGRELRAQAICIDFDLKSAHPGIIRSSAERGVVAAQVRSLVTDELNRVIINDGIKPELRARMAVTTEDIHNAVQRDWPLVFMDADASFGTAVYIRYSDCSSVIRDHFAVIQSYTYHDAVRDALLVEVGDRPWSDLAAKQTTEKLTGDTGRLKDVIYRIGEHLARPLLEILKTNLPVNILGITLVPCGILTCGVPLAAAAWTRHLRTRRFGDEYLIRYSPSAWMTARSIITSLLAEEAIRIGSPMLYHSNKVDAGPEIADLPAECLEKRGVSAVFIGNSSVMGFCEGSTVQALRDVLGPAQRTPPTHLLFSGHGTGSIFQRGSTGSPIGVERDPEDKGSSHILSATEIISVLPARTVRCVFLSSCSSAAFHTTHSSEIMTVPTAFLLNGAACVIGSIWEVYDVVASMMSTMFFRQHITEHMDPTVALGFCQNWLRTLTLTDNIFTDLPELRDLVEHMQTGLRICAGRYPFYNPFFWAGWIIVSV